MYSDACIKVTAVPPRIDWHGHTPCESGEHASIRHSKCKGVDKSVLPFPRLFYLLSRFKSIFLCDRLLIYLIFKISLKPLTETHALFVYTHVNFDPGSLAGQPRCERQPYWTQEVGRPYIAEGFFAFFRVGRSMKLHGGLK